MRLLEMEAHGVLVVDREGMAEYARDPVVCVA